MHEADGLLMQVAGQQGAYVARMINRGYIPGRGGLTAPFPCRRVEASSMSSQVCQSHQWLGLMPNCGGLRGHALGFTGRWRDLVPLQDGATADEKYFSKNFQFLSLGAMAYIGEHVKAADLQSRRAEIDMT